MTITVLGFQEDGIAVEFLVAGMAHEARTIVSRADHNDVTH